MDGPRSRPDVPSRENVQLRRKTMDTDSSSPLPSHSVCNIQHAQAVVDMKSVIAQLETKKLQFQPVDLQTSDTAAVGAKPKLPPEKPAVNSKPKSAPGSKTGKTRCGGGASPVVGGVQLPVLPSGSPQLLLKPAPRPKRPPAELKLVSEKTKQVANSTPVSVQKPESISESGIKPTPPVRKTPVKSPSMGPFPTELKPENNLDANQNIRPRPPVRTTSVKSPTTAYVPLPEETKSDRNVANNCEANQDIPDKNDSQTLPEWKKLIRKKINSEIDNASEDPFEGTNQFSTFLENQSVGSVEITHHTNQQVPTLSHTNFEPTKVMKPAPPVPTKRHQHHDSICNETIVTANGRVYRLLPIPTQNQNPPPRKPAKPPFVDLSRFLTATTDTVYDDTLSISDFVRPVSNRHVSLIEEYTEEDEQRDLIRRSKFVGCSTSHFEEDASDIDDDMYDSPDASNVDAISSVGEDDELYQTLD